MNVFTGKSVLLENLTWLEAEEALTPDSLVVIPLGAAAKEHGPHLKLNNDWRLAEYLKQQILEQTEVVIAPTVNYHYYPAFSDYPGSTSLRFETARDLIIDICTSLAHFGPRLFYVINTGVSTLTPLSAAAQILAEQAIRLHYCDTRRLLADSVKAVSEQAGGSHADEIETSLLLHIAPDAVDMSKAVKDYHPGPGRLSRDPLGAGTYSASGVYGDPTLASVAKGRQLMAALVAGLVREIRLLSAAQPDSLV